MASTKRTLSEQILRRLSAGNIPAAKNVHHLEIDQSVMQVLNALLRPQYFDTLNAGGNADESNVVVTYERVPVETYHGVSRSILPAMPVSLPRNAGLQRVYNADDVNYGAFIPATANEMEMLASQPLLNERTMPIVVKQRGKELIYSKDLTALSPTINSVTVEMVTMDYSKFTDYELLPISADMEAQVIETVYKMFAGEAPRPQTVDSTSDTK